MANLWINANHKVALATVIKTWGSSPRQVGSKMIVNEKGEFSDPYQRMRRVLVIEDQYN